MIPPRTYEIQTGYSLSLLQSDAVVAWAIDALASGCDSRSLGILAGLEPAFDHEEVKRLHACSLAELGVPPLPREQHVTFYITTVLRSMRAGARKRKDALKILADLYISLDYHRELLDFYLLYFAKSDLETQQVQWYWKGADRSNIDSIIDEYASHWLADHAIEEASNHPHPPTMTR